MRIAVLASAGSWHFQQLKRASAGRHEIWSLDFSAARVVTAGKPGEQSIFKCGSVVLNEIDCVITRAVPPGSLEQIVFRMDWLFQIESQLGIPVINSAKCIESSVDKYLSLEKIRQLGIQVPETRVSQTVADAMDGFVEFGCDAVVKPVFGSQGRGIERIRDRQAAELVFENCIADGRVVYQQRFIEHGESDIRLLVIGQQVIGMSRHRSGHWVINASQGASCSAHIPTHDEHRIAVDASRAVGALIAGVDIVYENQQPYVVEVNSCPSWKSISQVSQIDPASELIQLVESQVCCSKG